MPDPTLEPIVVTNPQSSAPSGTTYLNQDGLGSASAINLTLAGAAGQRVYVTGLVVTGLGATAGGSINAAITGLTQGGTMNIPVAVPTGAGVTAAPVALTFNPPLIGAVGGNVALAVPSFGAGNTASAASIWGYRA